MTKFGIGIDLGARSVKVVKGRMKGDRFQPSQALRLAADDDLAALLTSCKIRGSAVLGVTGKEMIIRYTQVTPMPDWQLKQVMGFEIDDLAVQSGEGLAADFNRLAVPASLSEDDLILLTLIKDTLLDEGLARLAGAPVNVSGFTPNAIALYNLVSRTADVDTGLSLVLDVGAENIDLVLIQEGSLIFARNLSGGSGLFNQAIQDGFNMSPEKAETVKKEIGCIVSRNRTGDYSPQQEKVARVLANPVGQIYSMIQSSLTFCKAQIKVTDLTLDRILLTGGGARLDGLKDYLADNMGVPCEVYDPARTVDLSQLDDPAELTAAGPEFTCALGLALMSATPDHYAIQVLPATVKKQQQLREHTLFGVLAALILVLFLGVGFYFSSEDSASLTRDQTKMRAEMKKRERWSSEMEDLVEENKRLIDHLNQVNDKVIPTTGFLRTFALVQRYLPDDLWVNAIEIDRVDREEFGLEGKPMPVVRIRGTGKEMGQTLQRSFTEFRKKLDADPLTNGVVPQVRYGDDFSFSLLVNYAVSRGVEIGEEESEEATGSEE